MTVQTELPEPACSDGNAARVLEDLPDLIRARQPPSSSADLQNGMVTLCSRLLSLGAGCILLLLSGCDRPTTSPVDQTAPTVQVSPDSAVISVPGTQAFIEGSYEDDTGVVKLSYRVNDGSEQELVITPVRSSTFGILVPLVLGPNTVVISAWDQAGNRGEVRLSLTRLRRIVGLSTGSVVLALGQDGSGAQVMVPDVDYHPSAGLLPDWSPDQSEVVFRKHSFSDPSQIGLYVVSEVGLVRRLIPNSPFASEHAPQYSHDGAWIYFGASQHDVQGLFGSGIWRIRPDGTGLEPIVPHDGTDYSAPSASPDGSRVVFSAQTWPTTRTIQILDLATRKTTVLPIVGYGPRWSPVGDQIAYIDAASRSVVVMRPDGLERRQLTTHDWYGPPVDWSQDGTKILARANGGRVLHVIDAASGQVSVVPGSEDISEAAW